MRKYQWNSAKLKKQNSLFAWVSLATIFVALLVNIFFKLTVPPTVVLLIAGIALLFLYLSWRAQSRDKKLKK